MTTILEIHLLQGKDQIINEKRHNVLLKQDDQLNSGILE